MIVIADAIIRFLFLISDRMADADATEIADIYFVCIQKNELMYSECGGHTDAFRNSLE